MHCLSKHTLQVQMNCIPVISLANYSSDRFLCRVDQDDEEQIYGNMNFEGGKNAGERWENYWKTATVFRGLDGPPKEK